MKIAMLLAPTLVGAGFLLHGIYIPAKALVAQILLAESWHVANGNTAKGAQKPWPWADFVIWAKLQVPIIGLEAIVLDSASGEALAFGPGLVYEGRTATGRVRVIAAHRDTHFASLGRVPGGALLVLQTGGGEPEHYRVTGGRVLDTRTESLQNPSSGDLLVLVTCYPFDALQPRGPLRYLVFAEKAA